MTFSVLGKRSGEWKSHCKAQQLLGRVSLAGVSLDISEFQENSSQTRGFTVGELLLRLQLRNTSQSAKEAPVLVLKLCSFIPGNDSKKLMMISIHLCSIIKKGIQGALWKCLQKVKPSNNQWQSPVLGLRNLGDIGKVISEIPN